MPAIRNVAATLTDHEDSSSHGADVLVFLAIVAFLYWLVATKSGKAVRSGLLRAIRHESGSV